MMLNELVSRLTKKVDVGDGVVVSFIPHTSLRSIDTYSEMTQAYGDDVSKWQMSAFRLWMCDAQTTSITVTDDSPEAWRVLSAYLDKAPAKFFDRLKLYQYLPNELVQAWYDAWKTIDETNVNRSGIAPRPTEKN